MKKYLIALTINHSKKTLSFVLLFTLFLSVFILKLDKDFSYRGFYHHSNKYIQNYQSFVAEFSGDDNIAIYLEHKEDIFKPEILKKISELTLELSKLKNVIKVTSLTNFVQISSDQNDIIIEEFFDVASLSEPNYISSKKTQALQDKILPGYLISKDTKKTLIVLRLTPSINETIDYTETIDKLGEFTNDLKKTFDEVYLVGSPNVSYIFKKLSQSDLIKIIPLCLFFIGLVIFLLFRQKSFIFLTLALLVLSIIATYSFAALVGVKYNNIIGAIPVILIAICVADSIHFYSVFQKYSESNLDQGALIKKTLEHIIFPTFLTTFSTSIGFISLSISEILPIKGLGILGAFGSFYAWVLTIFFIAPILMIFKIRGRSKNNIKASFIFDLKQHHQFVQNNKIIIIIVLSLISIVMGSLAFKSKINSDPLNYIPKSHPFSLGTYALESKLGGVQGLEIVLDSETPGGIYQPEFARKAERLVKWLESKEHYTKVLSYTNTIKQMHQAMEANQEKFYVLPSTQEKTTSLHFFFELSLPQGNSVTDMVNLDKSKARVRALWTVHGSDLAVKEFEKVENKMKQLKLKGQINGKMPIYHHMNAYVVETFFTSIISAILLIALMMILIFKSFKIGIISLIPNIFPLLWGGGLLYLLGKNIDMGSIVVCAICMGVAVDDTIHFLATYARHLSLNKTVDQSLEETLCDVGRPLCSTTLILVSGFLFFALGSFVPNVNLGIMTAFILSIALVMDFYLLPAILGLANTRS